MTQTVVKKVVGTVFARFFSAIITLVVVVMNARFLGAEKVGVISLIILAVTIVQMVNNFVGGSALVYLVPRTSLLKLFVPSVIWAVISTLIAVIILYFLDTIPEGYFVHVMFLSLMACLGSLNSMILIGQERIRAINIITVAQIVTIFVVLLIFYLFTGYREVMVYVIALYGSFGVLFSGTLALVSTRLRWGDLSGLKPVMREILKFGSWAQTANIFQLLNYRISYYFIERFLGEAPLGVYSTGVQLSEGVWLVPRSMSMVQYSRITNEKTREYAAKITLAFSKIGVLLSMVLVGVLVLLPTSVFTWIFGPEFSGVKPVIISLAVGIITLSFSILLSAFFTGLGKPVHSAIASGIGLVFTLVLSLWLIPVYGIIGAGIAASVAYTSSTIYQLILFVIMAKVKARDFLIRPDEVRMMVRELKGSLK